MQSTAPQTKACRKEEPPSQKKPYHSPNLRAAGNVREATEASAEGTIPDGMTSQGRDLFTYLSPT